MSEHQHDHDHDAHDHEGHDHGGVGGHSHVVNVKKNEKISATQVKLTIEVPYEEVAKHEESTARKFLNAAKLPGFRPGKAPMKMVKERYKDDIQKEVLSHLVEAAIYEALVKTKQNPINRPRIDFKGFNFDKKEPLTFEAEFEVQPDIELKNYKGIKLSSSATTASEEEITKAINDLRDRLSTLEPLDSKNPEKGDFAVVDIAYAVGDDPMDKTQTKQYNVELGNDQVLKELDEALLTMKVGDEKDVITKFPEDYHDKELANKETKYFCRLVELKKKVLPALDDSFANQLKAGATLDQIKEEIKTNIEVGKKQEAESKQRKDLLEHLVQNNPFEVASSLVESQMGRMAQWMEEDFKRRGYPKIEWKESDIADLRKRAEQMVRGSLLLKEVALKEKISLDEKIFDSRVEQMAKELNRGIEDTRKWLNGRGMLDKLKDEVITDQVYQFLLDKAEVTTAKKTG